MSDLVELARYGSVVVSQDSVGVRYLHLDIGKELAKDNAQSSYSPITAHYWHHIRSLLVPSLLAPKPPRVLLLGLGGGDAVRCIHKNIPDASITVVELYSDVVEAATNWFGISSSKVTIIVKDASEFVSGCSTQFDLVVSDIYDGRDKNPPIVNMEFLKKTQTLVAKDGFFAMNVIYNEPEFYKALNYLYPHVISLKNPKVRVDNKLMVGSVNPKYYLISELQSLFDSVGGSVVGLLDCLLSQNPHTNVRIRI